MLSQRCLDLPCVGISADLREHPSTPWCFWGRCHGTGEAIGAGLFGTGGRAPALRAGTTAVHALRHPPPRSHAYLPRPPSDSSPPSPAWAISCVLGSKVCFVVFRQPRANWKSSSPATTHRAAARSGSNAESDSYADGSQTQAKTVTTGCSRAPA